MQVKKVKQARRSLKSFTIAIIFFIGIQIGLTWYVNLDTVYNYRINYNMFLKNQNTMEVVIDEMAKKIKKENLSDYIILIGNSVSWGTNETSQHSLGYFLNDSAGGTKEKQAVFNLSAPSMQPGDIYTLLLMLDKKGISTSNLIIGLSYSAFNERSNGPRAVFWLGDQLKKLDPAAFSDVREQLVQSGYKDLEGRDYIEKTAIHKLMSLLPIYRYKDPVYFYWKQQKAGTDLLGNPKPWNEKKINQTWIKSYEYLNFFNPAPFDMTEANWGVYFMNRIFQHQENKKTLVFIAGANSELSKNEINVQGYQDNWETLRDYFAQLGGIYVPLKGIISADKFTDHTHLTKEGNQELAQILWRAWQNGEAQ